MFEELTFKGLVALGMNPASRVTESTAFFIADSVKILLLLFVLIAVIGFLRTYVSHERMRKLFSKRGGVGNLSASLFGAVTPFCSCSSIPLFIGFLEAGVPLGVAFSFLITSPLVNEYLVVIMLGFFGVKITLLYIASGILLGTVAGMILGRLGLEKELVTDLVTKRITQRTYTDWKARARFGLNEAKKITKSLWFWILLGVAVGAVIHNYVPQELILRIMERTGMLAVPLAILLGVPLYGNCAAIVPVAAALFGKGVPLGTALAFMMAISALSFPEAIILRRAMKTKLLAAFFAIVALGILLVGYVFNWLSML